MSAQLETICVQCGNCGESHPLDDWTQGGQLPRAEYQCPACNFAFRRELDHTRSWTPVRLVPIDPVLPLAPSVA